jgi:hypothetical protein
MDADPITHHTAEGTTHVITAGPPTDGTTRRVFLRLDCKGRWTKVTDEHGVELTGVYSVSYDVEAGGLPKLTVVFNEFTLEADTEFRRPKAATDGT